MASGYAATSSSFPSRSVSERAVDTISPGKGALRLVDPASFGIFLVEAPSPTRSSPQTGQAAGGGEGPLPRRSDVEAIPELLLERLFDDRDGGPQRVVRVRRVDFRWKEGEGLPRREDGRGKAQEGRQCKERGRS